jgi:hypothetical protein
VVREPSRGEASQRATCKTASKANFHDKQYKIKETCRDQDAALAVHYFPHAIMALLVRKVIAIIKFPHIVHAYVLRSNKIVLLTVYLTILGS